MQNFGQHLVFEVAPLDGLWGFVEEGCQAVLGLSDLLAQRGYRCGNGMTVGLALGNGGLGRLAACYLDSMASLGIPGFGYGINYQFGLFKQKFENGYQIEQADTWLCEDSPWQFPRHDRTVTVPIYGDVEVIKNANGQDTFIWMNTQHIYGLPFDFPIVGYKGKSVNYLRLFSAKTDDELDINIFNEGGYIDAVKDKIATETISKVLYPSDAVESGKKLRLTQQYFFVSCAMQDIIRRFLEKSNDFQQLPDMVCIQLNDTHPAIAIAEYKGVNIFFTLIPVKGCRDSKWF